MWRKLWCLARFGHDWGAWCDGAYEPRDEAPIRMQARYCARCGTWDVFDLDWLDD